MLLILCSSALASAGVIGTGYSPSTSVSYTPHIVKTVSTAPIGYTKIVQSPPVYQTVLTTKESNFQTPDGTHHEIYSKDYNTVYSSVKNFDSKAIKDGDVVTNTIPNFYSTAVHSPVVYHTGTAYTVSSPLVQTVHAPTLTKSVSVPVSYTTHNVPLTKTIVSPALASYSTPVYDKTKIYTSGLSSYSTGSSIHDGHPVRTTITYSEAPLVSHMSFTGLGANYAW